MADTRAGGAFLELSLRDKVTAGLLKARTNLQTFGAAAQKASLVFGGMSAAIVAPLTAATAGLIAGGKIDRVLALFQELQATLTDVAQQLVTAIEPVLNNALTITNGIALAASKWVKANAGLIASVAKVGVYLGVISAGLAAISAASNGLAAGFGAAGKAVFAISGFLATPLGITLALGAAIAGGVAAWMKFTSSGQAAAKYLIDAWLPTINFVKQLIFGIGDALAAGNLALAGKIAVKGLQIVFQEGVNSIADIVGGTLGDSIGEVGTKAIKGDLLGAWSTVVSKMASMWGSFSKGLVTVFVGAAKSVVDAWQSAVNGIAKGLLKASAEGGIKGKIASTILGVDVGKLQAENDAFDAQRGIKQNIFDIGFGSVGDSTNAIAGPVKEFLDGVKQAAEDSATASSANEAARPRSATRGDTGAMQAELDKLTKQAAKEKAAVATPPGFANKAGAGSLVGFSGSALALQLQGGGKDVQGRIAKGVEKNAALAGKAVDLLDAIKQRTKGFAIGA